MSLHSLECTPALEAYTAPCVYGLQASHTVHYSWRSIHGGLYLTEPALEHIVDAIVSVCTVITELGLKKKWNHLFVKDKIQDYIRKDEIFIKSEDSDDYDCDYWLWLL